MTWPSFFAASINAGVIGSGGGAAAMTRVENAAPASAAPAPLSMSRRDSLECFIGSFGPRVPARFWTPEIIFYSWNGARVYRRQPVPIAARLDGSPVQQTTRPGFGRLK